MLQPTAGLSSVLPGARWCGPCPAAGQGAWGSGQCSVLEACPIARWPMGCNIIIIPTNHQLASPRGGANSHNSPEFQARMRDIVLEGAGPLSILAITLSLHQTASRSQELEPRAERPRTLLLQGGRLICEPVTCGFCWDRTFLIMVSINKEDSAGKGRSSLQSCCFRCSSPA